MIPTSYPDHTTNPHITAAEIKRNLLPRFLLTNIQSFGYSVDTDKTSELQTTLINNGIDIACITETWLSENTMDYIFFQGYTSFHSVRNGVKRVSGGVSILVNEDYSVKLLNDDAPNTIENLWVSIRPKWLPRAISVVIVACIYYPGSKSIYAPSQEDLIQHITDTVHKFSQNYVNPLFIISGDFNDLNVDDICNSCKLDQVVQVPTRKDATLDLILTNMNNEFYKPPYTLPSICKSDHLCVIYEPSGVQKVKTIKKKITIRQFKKSAIILFGAWLTSFDWNYLVMIQDVDQKVTYFFTIMWAMIDKFFPLVELVITNNDKEWMTPEIKHLMNERQKAHLNKKFDLSKYLSNKVAKEIKKAKINHNSRKAELFSSSNSKE